MADVQWTFLHADGDLMNKDYFGNIFRKIVKQPPAQVAELVNLTEPYVHELCRTGRIDATVNAYAERWLATIEATVKPGPRKAMPKRFDFISCLRSARRG